MHAASSPMSRLLAVVALLLLASVAGAGSVAAAGGAAPAVGTAAIGDTAPPLLSAVSLSPTRFRVGPAEAAQAAAAPRGTTLRFTSSEAGQLSIVIEQMRIGEVVVVGGHATCKLVHHPVRHSQCFAFARVGKLAHAIQAGSGSVAFSGRVGGRALPAGDYRLTVTARDASGNVSKAKRPRFSIVR